jgi:hypothetical protein
MTIASALWPWVGPKDFVAMTSAERRYHSKTEWNLA